MSHFFALACMAISRYLTSRARSGPPPGGATCCVCSAPTDVVTSCCKAPLCHQHMAAWKAEPGPCACRRSR